jgi:putative ABC transport system ATP-binding protein
VAAVTPPALQAVSLYRFFRAGDEETQALRGVSVAVKSGELVAVAGPSGSGKSTLLSCLAGLDTPDGGMVHVAGQRLSHRPERERTRLRARHIGLLFQSANLLEHLSVDANLALVQALIPRPAGSTPAQRRLALLRSLDIEQRATATPSTLSGGEAARAGLAVALANDPAVLLADEPTGEVDADTEHQIVGLLRARADAGTAVVVVSHSAAVAGAADRVIRLEDGKIDDAA